MINRQLDRVSVVLESGGEQLDCWVVRPDAPGPWPVVMLLHGGGWNEGDPGHELPAAQALCAEGFAACVPGYRLAPTHRFPAQIEDIQTVLSFVNESKGAYDLDPDRVALWGLSAGGHLAAFVAMQRTKLAPTVRCAVSVQGILDLVAYAEYTLPATWARDLVADLVGGNLEHLPETARRASPLHQAATGAAPLLCVVFDGDLSVPADGAEKLVRHLGQLGVEAELLRDSRDWHSEIDPEEVDRRGWADLWVLQRPPRLVFHDHLVGFLRRHLNAEAIPRR